MRTTLATRVRLGHPAGTLAVSLLMICSAGRTAAAQAFTHPGSITRVSAPVVLDTTGMFQARGRRVGDDFFVSGQPTERALRELKAQGVTLVVNLRGPSEMRRVPFDEPAVVAAFGMRYLNLPIPNQSAATPAVLDAFADAVQHANGKVLLHCTVGWRASHLWAAYLIREHSVPVDSALANARAIGLDDMAMAGMGRQLVEGFLNRDLPSVGKRPPEQ